MSLTERAERVRHVLYIHLATHGTLPTSAALGEQLGLTSATYAEVLGELAEARHVLLDADGEIEMAHPFATRSFGFSVMGPRTLWWGGCAWDAFALPNLLPHTRSVLVATTCPACGAAHAWTVTDAGPPSGDQVAHFLTPVDRIWPNAAHACEHQRIFCSPRCVDDWLTRTGNHRGYVMSLDTLWRLAAHWYDGRLDSPYVRREPTEAAAYFRAVGLHGSFWGLAEPGDD